MSARTLRGGCHCGAIRIALTTSAELAARACQCAFCRKHGARSVSDPAGRARIVARDSTALTRYRFALRTADFLLCGACGVYVGALVDDGAAAWTTLNANVLADAELATRGAAPVAYDGESDESRVARRKARWTPADVLTIDRARSDEGDGATLLGEYFAGLRALVPSFDPARSVSADPAELVAPRGAFLVLRERGRALGCGALKSHAPGVGEIKRMYVRGEARGRGLGRELLEALEHEATRLGMRAVVLDTRTPEATAAVALYRASGYRDVPAFNDNPFANVWFEKDLAPPDGDAAVVAGFESTTLPPARFRHREHVLVAWTYLRALPFPEACARFDASLLRYVAAHGAQRKYDAALTRAYLELLAARIAASPGATTFDAFVAAHPDLLATRIAPAPRA